MCFVSSEPKRYIVRERDDYHAPRPVSNYHGGPRASATYERRRVSSAVPRERISYRSSYRSSSVPRASRDFVTTDVRKTSRTTIGYKRNHFITVNAASRRATPHTEQDKPTAAKMNVGRSLSIRSKKSESEKSGGRHHFTMSSLRGIQQPELSKKLYKLIKTENHQISAYEAAGRESQSVASQLSEWGESTEDESISDLSDKLGVLLAEVAEQEELFAQNLEDSRGVLKQIRNTESSVQPSRTHKAKIHDEIQKLKYKEPESTKLVTLEQELVRAEAQSLVAEAQLTNVTRQKFKEAYDLHTAAIIERAEKQILLARHARRLVNMLDDTPIVPGEERVPFAHGESAKEVLNDAEVSLKNWSPSVEPIHSAAGSLGPNAMPENIGHEQVEQQAMQTAEQRIHGGGVGHETMHQQSEDGSQHTQQSLPPYPTSESAATA